MPKKFGVTPFDPPEVYPDPVGQAKISARITELTDQALAEDFPASRLFAQLPAALARDIRHEAQEERDRSQQNSIPRE